MTSRVAKDFLVAQAAKQAKIEGIPLSELEKRMMYFTENIRQAVEDPTVLNEEFEAHCDSREYEAKIAKLLGHSYRRLKSEEPAQITTWNQAIGRLRRGDHYLLVMWDQAPNDESWWRNRTNRISVIGIVFGLLLLAAVTMVSRLVGRHISAPNPRLLLALFLGVALASLSFQKQFARAFGYITDPIIARLFGDREDAD